MSFRMLVFSFDGFKVSYNFTQELEGLPCYHLVVSGIIALATIFHSYIAPLKFLFFKMYSALKSL